MDTRREDRLYELQQALAELDSAKWPSFLETACSDDTSLRDEALALAQTGANTRRQRVHTVGGNSHLGRVLSTMLASGTRSAPT